MKVYRENKSQQDKLDELFCPEGTYFPVNDRRSVHYPAYYTAT